MEWLPFSFLLSFEALQTLRIIAIDFDDVMAATFAAMMKEHNAIYGTDLTADDICSNFLYQIKGWGTPLEVEGKLRDMGDILAKTEPLPGLRDAVIRLRGMGHQLYIVTARGVKGREAVAAWLAQQDITVGTEDHHLIAGMHFAGSWQNADEIAEDVKKGESGAELPTPTNEMLLAAYKKSVQSGKGALTKLEILRHLNADMFIDDSYTNLGPMFDVPGSKPQCLLFGTNQWADRRTTFDTPADFMTYDERQAAKIKSFGAEVKPCAGVDKVKDWDAVVAYVQQWAR